jgi:hypothetical protein
MISRSTLTAILLSFVLPVAASAQAVATSFEELRSLVKPGDTIHLTDATGRTISGRLADLSASSLEVLVRDIAPDGRESRRRLSESEVGQILVQRRDPVWRGTLIGLGVTALPAVWLISYGSQATREGYSTGEELIGTGVVLFGVGAGIGALIDAAINERTLVFYGNPNKRSGSVQVSPVVSKSAAGIQMLVRF